MSDVTTIVNDSTTYADGWIEKSQALIDKMGDFAYKELEDPRVDRAGYPGTDVVSEFLQHLLDDAPVRPEFAFPEDMPPPEAPEFEAFSSLSEVGIPAFTKAEPSLNVGTAPTLVFPDKGFGASPTFTPPTIGDGPDININSFGALPSLDAIIIPPAPNLPTIDFTAVAPANSDLAPPSERFSFNEQDYSSEMLDMLRLKLQSDLANGGYGIEVDDEMMLWDRAREREAANANQAVDEIERAFTSRRFSSPPGAFFGVLEKAQQSRQDASSTFSREVALKRADLYVQNRQFTIQQGSQLEGVLINYHGSKMERMLNASKYLIDSAIAAYNIRVTAYNAQLDGYKTDAQVFESRLRANGLMLEQYRTTADVEKIRADVNMTRINQYKAGIEAYNTLVNLYRAQVDAAQAKAGVERLNLDAFRAQVEAYVAQVSAKEAEFRAFESKVRGELGKAQIFDAQVRAYVGTVDATKARTEAESLVLKSEIEKAKAELDKYNSQITEYKATLDSLVQIEGLKERIYGSDIQAYSARIRSQESLGTLAINEFKANNDAYFSTLNYGLDKARYELERGAKQAELNFGAAKSSVDVYSSMITAALNSINALAVQTRAE